MYSDVEGGVVVLQMLYWIGGRVSIFETDFDAKEERGHEAPFDPFLAKSRTFNFREQGG